MCRLDSAGERVRNVSSPHPDDGSDDTARHALVAAGIKLAAGGFVVGSAGNLSCRHGDRVVITATGAELGNMTIDDTVVVNLAGLQVAGTRRPSSELPLHLGIYNRRPGDVGAIAHAHALASTAVSCVVRGQLPTLHYACAELGGPPRIAPYATFGTDQLAVNVLEALGDDRSAALMQNHGSVAVGATLTEAIARLELLEWICQLHQVAHQLGRPRVLDPDELRLAGEALLARRQQIDLA